MLKNKGTKSLDENKILIIPTFQFGGMRKSWFKSLHYMPRLSSVIFWGFRISISQNFLIINLLVLLRHFLFHNLDKLDSPYVFVIFWGEHLIMARTSKVDFFKNVKYFQYLFHSTMTANGEEVNKDNETEKVNVLL